MKLWIEFILARIFGEYFPSVVFEDIKTKKYSHTVRTYYWRGYLYKTSINRKKTKLYK